MLPGNRQIYGDLTGRFVAQSISDKKYILVVYNYDANTIHVDAFQSRQTLHIIDACKKILGDLSAHGISPTLLTIDNEIPTALVDFIITPSLDTTSLDIQLLPLYLRRRNPAERAIQLFKSHFTSILCGTYPAFPINLWNKILPQAMMTLNLLRTSRLNPKLSAYSQ